MQAQVDRVHASRQLQQQVSSQEINHRRLLEGMVVQLTSWMGGMGGGSRGRPVVPDACLCCSSGYPLGLIMSTI